MARYGCVSMTNAMNMDKERLRMVLKGKLAVNEKIADPEFLKGLDGEFFAGRTTEELIIHEFAHKRHHDAIKALYNKGGGRYTDIEECKRILERDLREYIIRQESMEPGYIARNISGYAAKSFKRTRKMNEVIAELAVKRWNNTIKDKMLEVLLKGVI